MSDDELSIGSDAATLGGNSSTMGWNSSIASGEETLTEDEEQQEEEEVVVEPEEEVKEEKGKKKGASERRNRETVGEVKWDVDAIFKGKGDDRIDVTAEVMAVIASHHLQPNNKPDTVRRYKAALNHCINAKPTKVEGKMLRIPLRKRSLEALLSTAYTTEYDYRILQASSFFYVDLKEVNGMLIEVEQKLKNMPDLVEDKKNEPSVDESDERVPWPADVNDETKPKEVRLKAFVDHLFRHVTDPEELLCLDWMAKCMANPEHYGSKELNVCQRAKILDYFHLALPSLHASPFELEDLDFDYYVEDEVKIIKINRSMGWNGGVDEYAEPHELLDKYPEMLARKAAKEKEDAEKKEKERLERRAKAKEDRQKKREEERAQKEMEEKEKEKKRESKRIEKAMREKEDEKKKRERWEKEMKKGVKYEDDVDSVTSQDQSSDVRKTPGEKKRESKRAEKEDEKTKRERFAKEMKKGVKWEDEVASQRSPSPQFDPNAICNFPESTPRPHEVLSGEESEDIQDSEDGEWSDAREEMEGYMREVKMEEPDEEEEEVPVGDDEYEEEEEEEGFEDEEEEEQANGEVRAQVDIHQAAVDVIAQLLRTQRNGRQIARLEVEEDEVDDDEEEEAEERRKERSASYESAISVPGLDPNDLKGMIKGYPLENLDEESLARLMRVGADADEDAEDRRLSDSPLREVKQEPIDDEDTEDDNNMGCVFGLQFDSDEDEMTPGTSAPSTSQPQRRSKKEKDSKKSEKRGSSKGRAKSNPKSKKKEEQKGAEKRRASRLSAEGPSKRK